MTARPFPTEARMTAITLAYSNPDRALIADDVMPRTPTAADFKWKKYDMASGYTVPDLKVGRKSYPIEVEFSAVDVVDQVFDYALDDFIPNEDLEVGEAGIDHRGQSVSFMTNLLLLAREIRVAALAFNPASYAPQNQTVLAGPTQWSDQVNSDPVSAMSDALDTPIYRPNIAVFGQAAWTKIRRHPKLVQAVKGTAQGAGLVSRQEFAELFELDHVYVGAGFVNTAKKGQVATTARVWGKHAALIYRDRSAGPQAGITWGFTAEWGKRRAGSIADQKRGATGGESLRVLERVKELVAAPDLGYFFQDVVA